MAIVAEKIERVVDDIMQKQLPYAASVALNESAKEVVKELRAEMKRVFNRPTNWTLNSLLIKFSSKENLEAYVKISDDMVKGTAPGQYLAPQVFGGERPLKRSESYLRANGILPSNMYMVPGRGAIDPRTGNMKAGEMTRILSSLRAFPETGYTANQTANSRFRNKKKVPSYYFLIKDRNNRLPMGVWSRKAGILSAKILFINKPYYKIRFRFFEVARDKFNEVIQGKFNSAMRRALDTAKKD